jgi:phosphatidylserine/phosphatidylglycerophosphate/cardiolipin synthase-like enzyme
MATKSTPDLFTRAEYFIALIKRIEATKKGGRVAVASMTLDSAEPLIARLMESLCAAARRGVHVYLTIDAYTFLSRGGKIIPGPLWRRSHLPEVLAAPYGIWLHDLQKLKASGGHYGVSNVPEKPFRAIPKGRSHIKGAVVNNYVFIGGCNLHSPQQTDIMIGQAEKTLADWLYDWLSKLTTSQSTLQTLHGQDQLLQLKSGTEILIDSGVRNQSTIYDHALQLIDEAQEWIFLTCQYFPGGQTASHLYAAHKRGVAVRIVYSHPHAHGQKAIMHYVYNALQRVQLPAQFFIDRRPYDAPNLHAKVLATENGVMVGSHNYVEQGVHFGTAEIALLSHEPGLTKRIINVITDQL